MQPDIDVHADHPPTFHRLAEARIIDERAAMRDPGFDDDVGLNRVDGFLHADHIVGQLDNRVPLIQLKA